MVSYIFQRIFLIVPTLFGIMLVNFAIIQFLPGGPVEQMMANIKGHGQFGGSENRLYNSGDDYSIMTQTKSNPLDDEILAEVKALYQLDKPPHERFFGMLKSYIFFDFGDSFFKDRPVVDLVLEKMPVSISLGIWTTLIVYLISIPLGIAKSVRNGSKFDISSSTILAAGYAIPNFLFAVFLLVVFAGGEFFNWFPIRGLVSDNFTELSPMEKIFDYFHHLALPLVAMVIGGFASLTMLTKNSFLDELHKQYVTLAYSKGLTKRSALYGHVFRNAMLLIISSFPATLLSLLFTSSLLIEVIFSLDGLGRLGYDAALKHDYPIIFGSLFFFSLLGLALKILSDICYVLVDPRIHFGSKSGS